MQMDDGNKPLINDCNDLLRLVEVTAFVFKFESSLLNQRVNLDPALSLESTPYVIEK